MARRRTVSTWPRTRPEAPDDRARRTERATLAVYDALIAPFVRRLGTRDDHVRVLLQFRLRMRERRPLVPGMQRGRAGQALLLFMLLLVGGAIGFMMTLIDDPYWRVGLAATATLGYLTLFIALEFGEVMTDRAEADLVAPAPVDDGAVIAARTLYLGLTLALYAVALGLGPLLLGGIGLGVAAWIPFFAVVLALVTALATLTILALFSLLLRVVGAERFRSVVAWAQVAMIAATTGGFQVLPHVRDALDVGEPGEVWHLLWPPFWFGGMHRVAHGDLGAVYVAQTTLALGVPPLLFVISTRLVRRRLVATITSAAVRSDPGPERPSLLTRWGRLVTRDRGEFAAFEWARALMRRETPFRVRTLPGVLVMAAFVGAAVLRDVGTQWAGVALHGLGFIAIMAFDGQHYGESPKAGELFDALLAPRDRRVRTGTIHAILAYAVWLPGVVLTPVIAVWLGPVAGLDAAIAVVWSGAVALFLATRFVGARPFSQRIEDAHDVSGANAIMGFVSLILSGGLAGLHFAATHVPWGRAAFALAGLAALWWRVSKLRRIPLPLRE